jgi:hypothetical protein
LRNIIVALVDRMPNQDYGKDIETEIERLESEGESIMELMFLIYAIPNKINWHLTFNDLENLRI